MSVSECMHNKSRINGKIEMMLMLMSMLFKALKLRGHGEYILNATRIVTPSTGIIRNFQLV